MALLVVAEDDTDIREIMVRVLRRAGHEVLDAPDGAAGLRAVREHRPDLLVSDIDMPIMTGVELALAVRADPATADVPVLFVSGSLSPGDVRPDEAGVTAVLLKPFLPRELVACVEKVLNDGHDGGRAPTVCP